PCARDHQYHRAQHCKKARNTRRFHHFPILLCPTGTLDKNPTQMLGIGLYTRHPHNSVVHEKSRFTAGESGRIRAMRPVVYKLRLVYAAEKSVFESGSSRTRFPVAAKMALHNAGANGGTPGSPTPAGGSSLSSTCTFTWYGASPMRA